MENMSDPSDTHTVRALITPASEKKLTMSGHSEYRSPSITHPKKNLKTPTASAGRSLNQKWSQSLIGLKKPPSWTVETRCGNSIPGTGAGDLPFPTPPPGQGCPPMRGRNPP